MAKPKAQKKLTKTKALSFEQKLAPLVGPILLLAMVAISAFLLGRNYQSHLTPTVAATTGALPATDTSAIESIQSALNAPPAAASGTSSPVTSSAKSTTQAPASSGIININTATAAELDTLPGIGPTYAQRIIDYRTQNGAFTRVDDLTNVKGIGPKTLDKIRGQITV